MTRDPRLVVAILVGGFVGAVLRAELAEAWPHSATSWPWATFVANIVGAFTLGYVFTRLQERLAVTTYRRPLLATGFCGGLTTFSTMQLELLRMLDADAYGLAAAYAAVSIVVGLAAVFVASQLVRRARVLA